MNLASRFGFSASLLAAATLVGCVDEQEEPPPLAAPPTVRAPARSPQPIPTTHLPYYEYRSEGDYGTARPRSPYTIDLGYVGDWQFGSAEAPPSGSASWTRPFPCNWTRSCAMTTPDLGSTRDGYAMPRPSIYEGRYGYALPR